MLGSLSSINLIYCRFFLAHKFCYWSSLRQASKSSFFATHSTSFFYYSDQFPFHQSAFFNHTWTFSNSADENFNQLPNMNSYTIHSTVICLSLNFLLSCFLSSIECTFACGWWWWCLSLTLICFTKWFFFLHLQQCWCHSYMKNVMIKQRDMIELLRLDVIPSIFKRFYTFTAWSLLLEVFFTDYFLKIAIFMKKKSFYEKIMMHHDAI